MSWANRIRNPAATPPMQEVQAAAQNLAEQAGIAPGKVRVVFQTVADVALVGTVVISGALAALHLYKTLFPRRKEDQHSPEPAGGDHSPPRHRGPRTAVAADDQDGHEEKAHRAR